MPFDLSDTPNLLADVLGQGLIVGMHLVSVHSHASYPVCNQGVIEQRRFEAVNPGLYMRLPSGLTAGLYRNSFGVASAYAGWTFETADGRWALTVGGITGYGRTPGQVAPLIVPSVRLGLDELGAPGWSARLSFAAKNPRDSSTAAALHLSVERQF
jgi:hypothetical protein